MKFLKFNAGGKNFAKFITFILVIFGVFFVLIFFGPLREGFLIGPTGVPSTFYNATRASNPDIVITNISFPPEIRAGVQQTINVTVNVTNGNGSAGLGSWKVKGTPF